MIEAICCSYTTPYSFFPRRTEAVVGPLPTGSLVGRQKAAFPVRAVWSGVQRNQRDHGPQHVHPRGKRAVCNLRGEITPLSSSYNISGLVPVCWLFFQCFWLKPAKLPKSLYIWTCPGVFLRDEQWKWTKTYMITCIYIMSQIVHSYFLRFWRYSDKQTNQLLFLLHPYEVYCRDIPNFGSRVALATWQTDRLVLI